MSKINRCSLLGKKKEKEVLMNFMKTRNYREKKKLEERAEKRREASRKKYMRVRKDKVKEVKSSIKISKDKIMKYKDEIKNIEANIIVEEARNAKASIKIKTERKEVKTKLKKK